MLHTCFLLHLSGFCRCNYEMIIKKEEREKRDLKDDTINADRTASKCYLQLDD